MTYHSKDGCEFIGLRTLPSGQYQIVYDATSGERVFVTIRGKTKSPDEIDAAMQEGIGADKVMPGLLSALHSRNIRFELSS